VYRAELLRDQPPKLDAQAAEDVFVVERVKTALVDRDEALHKAREDLAGARTLAAEWEAEVASVRAQLQQDRATLERARAWQSQAEERAKEAEGLRTSLADKAAALATTEEQLRQEQVARQRVEAQLQQERAASPRPGLPSSVSVWGGKRRRASSSKSVPHLRGRGRPSSSGMTRSRGSTGS
jgi:DNA repair exonuclease SbcCD ATPase subunit